MSKCEAIKSYVIPLGEHSNLYLNSKFTKSLKVSKRVVLFEDDLSKDIKFSQICSDCYKLSYQFLKIRISFALSFVIYYSDTLVLAK